MTKLNVSGFLKPSSSCCYNVLSHAKNHFQMKKVAQSAGDVKYTDCFSAEGLDLPLSTNVLDMTLMMRFQ